MPALSVNLELPAHWRLSDLLRLSQTAAGRHLDELGFRDDAGRRGLVWVIIRTRGEVLAPPEAVLRVETWPGGTRLGMMPRYCRMYNADGTLAVQMVSTWVLADVQTRQMRPDADIPIPDMSRGDEPPLPRSLPRRELPFLGTFSPLPGQIDKNGHMNNAAYPDAVEAAAAPLLRDRTITAFALDYRAEVLPGTEISVFGAKKENVVYLCGKTPEKEHFRMSLTLSPD